MMQQQALFLAVCTGISPNLQEPVVGRSKKEKNSFIKYVLEILYCVAFLLEICKAD